jgi:hypothetical protein
MYANIHVVLYVLLEIGCLAKIGVSEYLRRNSIQSLFLLRSHVQSHQAIKSVSIQLQYSTLLEDTAVLLVLQTSISRNQINIDVKTRMSTNRN